jgi:hypothetical protein
MMRAACSSGPDFAKESSETPYLISIVPGLAAMVVGRSMCSRGKRALYAR